jgi:glycosyltransferase involved in cell wall biosynthesis
MTKASICILTETFHPVVGGGETQALALAEGLTRRGFAVHVVTRRSDPSLERSERVGPVRVHRLPPAGSGQLKKWGLVFTGLLALVRLRRRHELVFVSGFRILGIPAVLASRLFAKPCILKADSLGEFSGEFFHRGLRQLGLPASFWPFRALLALRNRLLRRCDRFVAVSSAIEEELRVQGVQPESIERIPNGVDVSRFSPVDPEQKESLRDRLQIPRAARTAIFTGRLVSYKGLPLLLQVWEEIQRRHSSARLLLVGSGGLDVDNCEMALRSYVESKGLQQSVHFAGAVENVDEYLQASDVFVFPTEQEAFGISVVEAMACGLPVISTPVGGLADIVTGGENGVCVAVGSYDQLLSALDSLLSDPTLADALGREGRRAAEERFALEAVLDRSVDLFESALRSRLGAHRTTRVGTGSGRV